MSLGPRERIVWNDFVLGIGDLLLADDSFNVVVGWSSGCLTLGIIETHVAHFHGLKVFFCPLKVAGKHHGIPLIFEVTTLDELITVFKVSRRFIIVRLEILNGIVIAIISLLSRLRSLFAAGDKRLFVD